MNSPFILMDIFFTFLLNRTIIASSEQLLRIFFHKNAICAFLFHSRHSQAAFFSGDVLSTYPAEPPPPGDAHLERLVAALGLGDRGFCQRPLGQGCGYHGTEMWLGVVVFFATGRRVSGGVFLVHGRGSWLFRHPPRAFDGEPLMVNLRPQRIQHQAAAC